MESDFSSMPTKLAGVSVSELMMRSSDPSSCSSVLTWTSLRNQSKTKINSCTHSSPRVRSSWSSKILCKRTGTPMSTSAMSSSMVATHTPLQLPTQRHSDQSSTKSKTTTEIQLTSEPFPTEIFSLADIQRLDLSLTPTHHLQSKEVSISKSQKSF